MRRNSLSSSESGGKVNVPSDQTKESSVARRPGKKRAPRSEKPHLAHVLRKIHTRNDCRGDDRAVLADVAILERLEIPRVLRTDIRRHYCQYLATVRNSSNALLTMDFIRTFAHPGIKVSMHHELLNLHSETSGHATSMAWYEYFDCLIPDAVMTVTSPYLLADRKGDAVLTCDFYGRGTLVVSRSSSTESFDLAGASIAPASVDYAASSFQDAVRTAKISKRLFSTRYESESTEKQQQQQQQHQQQAECIDEMHISREVGGNDIAATKQQSSHMAVVQQLGGLSQWRTVSSNNYSSGVVSALPVRWRGTLRMEVGPGGRIQVIEVKCWIKSHRN